jgi:tetratricopeptide (TPR) repeat protein
MRPRAWAPALAVLVVAVSVSFWLRPEPIGPIGDDADEARGRESVQEPAGPVGEPAGRTPQAGPPQPPAGSSLTEPARFRPPSYSPPTLRDAADEATAQFREAMSHYARGDYRAAIPGLRRASRLDPEAPHAFFFLGICEMLSGRVEAGTGALRRTIALGESAYLEEAQFCLAKGLLLKGDVPGARRVLDQTIALRGELEVDARRLRDRLETVRPAEVVPEPQR